MNQKRGERVTDGSFALGVLEHRTIFSASRLWNLREFPKLFQKILPYNIIGIVKIGKCSDQLLSKPGNRFYICTDYST